MSLEIVNTLGKGLLPILAQGGPPARSARRVVTLLTRLLGAEGGVLSLWSHDGNLVFSITRGLRPENARRLRRVVQNPPPGGLQEVQGLGTILINEEIDVATGWQGLNQLVRRMAQGRTLALWSLPVSIGQGLLILSFKDRPRWAPGLAQALSGHMGLALSHLLLSRRAKSRQEDYQRIFENSKDMVYLSTRDGNWVEVNQAGVEMLGYSSKRQLLAVTDSARSAYQDPKDRWAFMKAIEKNGFVRDYEVNFKKKDGTLIFVSITAQVRTEEGEVVGYEGIIKDITARKEAEARAEEERRRIAAILEVVPVAIFVVDPEHRVVHWNRACEELTGVSREDILGKTGSWSVFQKAGGTSLADLLVADREDVLDSLEKQGRISPSSLSPQAWEAEMEFGNLGGKARSLFFSAATLRSRQGEIKGSVEAILDLTRLKQLEESLADSERLYRTMVESNWEGIALHDGDRFLIANQSFLEMFEISSLDAAPKDFLQMVDPGFQASYLAWRRQMLSGQGVSNMFEGKGLRIEGGFHMELVAAPISYKGRLAVLYTVRDVTQRKTMEDQLIRSERLAATGKLAFDIAHEVNNPLGGILTFSHLLAEDIPEENPAHATVQKIIKLTDRCKVIIRGLLDFARQDQLKAERLTVNQVINELFGLLQGHTILQGVEIILDLDESIPKIQGQRNKLEQVFLNMVINAAEAMEGKGRLRVVSEYHDENSEVLVSFADSGPGISLDVQPRLFEPFFTTKSIGKGTGLGLAISHGIIKQHGGRIQVSSVPGSGAIFTVALPRNLPHQIEKL